MKTTWKHRAARFQFQLVRALLGSFGGAAVLGITFAFASDLMHFGAPARSVQNLVISLPFPLQSATALLLGFYVSPPTDRKYAYWVWIVGTAYLVLRVATFQTGSVFAPSRWAHYFGAGCRLPHCWDQFTVTAPWIVLIAYSVGSLLSYKETDM